MAPLATSCCLSPTTGRMLHCRPGTSMTSSMFRCCARLFKPPCATNRNCPSTGLLPLSSMSCGLTIRDIARDRRARPFFTGGTRGVARLHRSHGIPALRRSPPRAGGSCSPIWSSSVCCKWDIGDSKNLCAEDAHWRFSPALTGWPPSEREELVRTVLDQFRRKLAISCRVLHETVQQQLRRRAEQHLDEFWGLDPDINELRTANRFVRRGQSAREN